MSEVAPVVERRRIASLDVMRGFAVLGILAVNAAYFAAPWQAALNPTLGALAVTEDTLWSWVVMHVVFEFKCITLFSILFGASIYMVGGERDDRERGAVLRRRLIWLAVFGLIHGVLIWYGDILFAYAISGFFVLMARSWRPRTLFTAGAALIVFSVLLQGALALLFSVMSAEKLSELSAQIWAPKAADMENVVAAYQGGALGALRQNIIVWLQIMVGSLPFLLVRTIGVMMVGMALYKVGFLSGNARPWVYGLVLALGAVALALIFWQAMLNIAADFEVRHMQARGAFANFALAIFVSLAYASICVLLVKAGARVITGPLAAVGRMAFTNYIAQSLIMTTIFTGGRGFGFYGEVDRVTLWAVVIAVWALQLVWSPLWLAKFQMGPLEWLWRRLSYGRPVALTKAG